MNYAAIKNAAPKVIAACAGLAASEVDYLLNFLRRNLDRPEYLHEDIADREAQAEAALSTPPTGFNGSMKITRATGETEEVKI